MRNMTYEEIKEIVGTEFTYVFEDNSEIPAVVAAFDPAIGVTCLATALIDSFGHDFSHNLDANGNLCLVAYNAEALVSKLPKITRTLRSIKYLGYYKTDASARPSQRGDTGAPACYF